MKVSFYGAAGEVTGSNYLIEAAGRKILVDCGLFQGGKFAQEKNYRVFPYRPSEIDAVALTHAHLDHCGRLPRLFGSGFHGPIWASEPTIDLAAIVLEDAANLIHEEAQDVGHEPLYTPDQAVKALRLFRSVDYRKPFEIVSGVKVTYFDAGHILGSAFILVEADGQSALFSADLGNTPAPILRPTDSRPPADLVVIESTYGGRLHQPLENRVALIRELIQKARQHAGVVLIPVFAVERAQEILYELNNLSNQHQLSQVPIFLDSPMAIETVAVFKKYRNFWSDEARKINQIDSDLFSFPGVTYTASSEQSKSINHLPPPKIILAGSGMLNGGRILHHAIRYLPDPTTVLVIVGFQVPGTLGRQIVDGSQKVHIMHQEVKVAAKTVMIEAYSGHADQNQLLQWFDSNSQLPKQVIASHGEPEQAATLCQRLEQKHRISAHPAKYGETVEI